MTKQTTQSKIREILEKQLDKAMGHCRTYPTGGTHTRDAYVESILSAIIACVVEDVEKLKERYNTESDYISDERNLRENIGKCKALEEFKKGLTE